MFSISMAATLAFAAPADCDDTYRIPDNPLERRDYPGEPVVENYRTGPRMDGPGGRVVVPNTGKASGSFPTAWIVHGIGFAHTDYQTLQDRLAHVGIASVAVEYVADPNNGGLFGIELFETLLVEHITLLHGPNAPLSATEGRLGDRIALVGHSMGGGLVVGAAPQVAALGSPYLSSVVAMAPNSEQGFVLTRDEAEGLLVVLGSNDADDGVNQTYNSGFSTYDLSGAPFREVTFSGPVDKRFTKSMVYVDGAEHASYSDPGSGPGDYRDVVHAYVTSYLLWSLRDEQEQHVFFKQGEVLDGATDVQVQWTEPTFRRVLENFESVSNLTNTLGGQNTFADVTTERDDANDLFDDSPHDTRALRVVWTSSGDPKLVFGLPLPEAGADEVDRDLSKRRYLSLRVGQPASANSAVNFSIVLRDGSGSQSHPISAFGTVRDPFTGVAETDEPMETILVPLCAYDQIDRTKVVSVELVFDRRGHSSGEIQLDLLEFID